MTHKRTFNLGFRDALSGRAESPKPRKGKYLEAYLDGYAMGQKMVPIKKQLMAGVAASVVAAAWKRAQAGNQTRH